MRARLTQKTSSQPSSRRLPDRVLGLVQGDDLRLALLLRLRRGQHRRRGGADAADPARLRAMVEETNGMPITTVERGSWGRGAILVMVTGISAALGIAIATAVGASRVLFSMAREGLSSGGLRPARAPGPRAGHAPQLQRVPRRRLDRRGIGSNADQSVALGERSRMDHRAPISLEVGVANGRSLRVGAPGAAWELRAVPAASERGLDRRRACSDRECDHSAEAFAGRANGLAVDRHGADAQRVHRSEAWRCRPGPGRSS